MTFAKVYNDDNIDTCTKNHNINLGVLKIKVQSKLKWIISLI